MIGNDLIDLTAVLPRSEEKWQRYRQKIMSKREQHLFASFRSGQADIWLAWAMKESVYKLEYQLVPKRYFAPQQITCLEFDAPSFTGLAQGKFGQYPFSIEKEPSSIHALTWMKNRSKPSFWSFLLDDLPLQEHLMRAVNQQFPKKSLQYHRWPFPSITLNDKIELPVSMSHHGKLGAYAF